jgi:hypothetical protein
MKFAILYSGTGRGGKFVNSYGDLEAPDEESAKVLFRKIMSYVKSLKIMKIVAQ